MKKEHIVENFSLPSSLIIQTVLFFVLIIAALVPNMKQMQLSTRSLQEVRAQTALVEQAVNDRINAQEDVLELDNRTILDDAILKENDIIIFIEQFESAAEKANIDHILRFKTEERKKEKTLSIIPITIQANGELPDILKFIEEIEILNIYINPTSVSLKTDLIDEKKQELFIEAYSYWEAL